ncbi:hypothetical protein SCLCIDRAFT_1222737 [Scleroderma citrinum Foug A]|uniref:Uncharacterized protein n=1 Tax=Scleroderma citrinum Foug A TaxID=1036808 RepID=A0A0C3CY51_9AGAM|nr:hypothetical protein SCLCIDRAFT_1222737 [Scleroderma citrinum Foug A]
MAVDDEEDNLTFCRYYRRHHIVVPTCLKKPWDREAGARFVNITPGYHRRFRKL